MAILIKDAAQPSSPRDGARVLVERRRPRGIQEEALALRASFAALAPSDELRRWFDERPRQWLLFRRRYLAELCDQRAAEALAELHEIADAEAILTLLTLAAEPERSHGAILRDILQGSRKPPASSGPARATAGKRASARRRR